MNDGPLPPDSFRIGDRVHHGIRGKQFALIDFLWPRPNKMADVADVVQFVWNRKRVNQNTVDLLLHRANTKLATFGAPWGVRRSGETVVLYDRRMG